MPASTVNPKSVPTWSLQRAGGASNEQATKDRESKQAAVTAPVNVKRGAELCEGQQVRRAVIFCSDRDGADWHVVSNDDKEL